MVVGPATEPEWVHPVVWAWTRGVFLAVGAETVTRWLGASNDVEYCVGASVAVASSAVLFVVRRRAGRVEQRPHKILGTVYLVSLLGVGAVAWLMFGSDWAFAYLVFSTIVFHVVEWILGRRRDRADANVELSGRG